jgi:hypothetical protein
MDLVFGAHTARARIPRPCTLACASRMQILSSLSPFLFPFPFRQVFAPMFPLFSSSISACIPLPTGIRSLVSALFLLHLCLHPPPGRRSLPLFLSSPPPTTLTFGIPQGETLPCALAAPPLLYEARLGVFLGPGLPAFVFGRRLESAGLR